MADNASVVEFLRTGFALYEELQRSIFARDSTTAEVSVIRCEEYIYGVSMLYRLQRWPEEIKEGFTAVIMLFQEEGERLITQLRVNDDNDNHQYACPMEVNDNNSPGRPRFSIPKEQIDGLRGLHFSWKKIAEMLGVSERTIRRRRQELGMEIGEAATYSDIADGDLDTFVQHILHYSPNSGERMVIGALKGFGIKVQRERVRDSIRRVDPISRELRRKTSIHRRIYNVKTPNALWHIDGNHKLIRWRFVIHGGIDGFSRTIVYLACSTNNTSHTVFQLFLQSMQTYKCPRRIRSDHGTENVAVARWMLHHFGVDAKPFITGLSVHNQRIERLWKDVNLYVTSYFSNLFYYLESLDLLDPLNELHLFALHYVFKPRINRALKLFASQWNHHPLSSERNMSPYQLWIEGFYMFANSDHGTIQEVVDPATMDVNSYGIDDDGPFPQVQTVNHVEIPESTIIVPEEGLILLSTLVNPLEEDDEHGKQVYINACSVLGMITE